MRKLTFLGFGISVSGGVCFSVGLVPLSFWNITGVMLLVCGAMLIGFVEGHIHEHY